MTDNKFIYMLIFYKLRNSFGITTENLQKANRLKIKISGFQSKLM